MIRSVLWPFLTVLAHATFAQATLTVSVILNKPAAGGVLRVALCPTKEAYDTEQGCVVQTVPATGNVVTVTFPNVRPGACAVKVFHDINSDNELNTSWIGWPKEPYGFSNDAPVNMGPPSYKHAMFSVKQGANSARVVLR
jgi:uncharacterized protein (DUF2141 family)